MAPRVGGREELVALGRKCLDKGSLRRGKTAGLLNGAGAPAQLCDLSLPPWHALFQDAQSPG